MKTEQTTSKYSDGQKYTFGKSTRDVRDKRTVPGPGTYDKFS